MESSLSGWIIPMKGWVAIPVLVLVMLLESWIPLFPERRRRVPHDALNIAMALINALPLALIAATATAGMAHLSEVRAWGLFQHLSIPSWSAALLAVVALDAWMYGWHRANHLVPFLWRFHRMHHSDPSVDATSAFRFHLGEVVMGSVLRLILIPILGLSVWHLVLYDSLLLPVIIFHHSQIRLPAGLDRFLRVFIVTPGIHQVHHSDIRRETDSNFSSIFSWWDRLFGTLRLRDDNRTLHFGLPGWDRPDRQSLKGLLVTPLLKTEPSPDSAQKT